MSAQDSAEKDVLPQPGEVWQWSLLMVDIIKAGPKRVTYRVGSEVSSVPTDRFLRRFHRTGLGRPIPPAAGDQS